MLQVLAWFTSCSESSNAQWAESELPHPTCCRLMFLFVSGVFNLLGVDFNPMPLRQAHHTEVYKLCFLLVAFASFNAPSSGK